LTEVLKQVNYAPMPVSEQVVMLYLATNGFLDDIPENRLRLFEDKILGQIRSKKSELLTEVEEKKTISKTWEETLGALTLDCKEEFRNV
jgi:F-type H+-transporting ATPase subunit alpha